MGERIARGAVWHRAGLSERLPVAAGSRRACRCGQARLAARSPGRRCLAGKRGSAASPRQCDSLAAMHAEHLHRLQQVLGLLLQAPAAAAASSTSAAFCCVTWSIWVTAWLTCSMPALCSALAALISPMMSVTRVHAGDDLLHRRARPARPAACRPRPCSTESRDQRLDLLGRRGAALRQAAHLGGHHREAAALLAGARRLDRRVQRQDVGLEGDAVDHADDVGDLACEESLMPPIVPHHLATTTCAALAATSDAPMRQLVGLARVVGVLLARWR